MSVSVALNGGIVVHFTAMGMLRTLRKIGDSVARAVSVLSVSLCLAGSAGICLCESDPDGCGENCHECDGHPSGECRHLTIDVDDFVIPQSDDILPVPAVAGAPVSMMEIPAAVCALRMRPISTAPPGAGGGRYVSYSSRIHPLS
jgi:hypothetical protein